jgi:ketosteroid isomerase-like protein
MDAYASFVRGDIDGFFKGFDDKSELIEADSLPYGGVHRGIETARKALMSIGAVWGDINFQIAEVVTGEKYVVAFGRFSATARKSGKKVNMPLAEVWRIENNRVISVTPLYFDTAAAAAALA